MNNILQLKGRFEQRPNASRPGSPKLPKEKVFQHRICMNWQNSWKEFLRIGRKIQILMVLW